MMEFGFGAFLEKFETHFGKRPTKVLLSLIGLAIVAATGSLIWHTALEPIVSAIVKDMPTRPRHGILNLFWLASVIGAGIAAGFGVAAGLVFLLRGHIFKRHVKKLAKSREQTDRILSRAEHIAKQLRDANAASSLLFDEMINIAKSRGIFTQYLVDEIQSLLDTESQKQP
jgi:hypothetical protein